MTADFSTIRELIGELIGKSLLDITQHDEEYLQRTGRGFVDLMFSDGNVLRVYSLHPDEPMMALNPDDESEEELAQ